MLKENVLLKYNNLSSSVHLNEIAAIFSSFTLHPSSCSVWSGSTCLGEIRRNNMVHVHVRSDILRGLVQNVIKFFSHLKTRIMTISAGLWLKYV